MLKPNEFDGVTDKRLKLPKYKQALLDAIRKRKDLDPQLIQYLTLLTKYADGERIGIPEMKKYAANSRKFHNEIDKDFSELLAPIIILNMSKADLKNLGLDNLNKRSSEIFLPQAGNYPLVDFIIYVDRTIDIGFSVKKNSGATNVIKPGDIVNTLKPAKYKKLRERVEYIVLQILNDNPAKSGPTTAFAYLLNQGIPMLKPKSAAAKIFKAAGGNVTEADIAKDPTAWWSLMEEIGSKYYSEGMSSVKQTWKERKYHSVLSILSEYAIAKISKNEKKLVYTDYINAVKTSVNYFKFALNSNGTFDSVIENSFNVKVDKDYFLRAKNRLKRPYSDKLGVQP